MMIRFGAAAIVSLAMVLAAAMPGHAELRVGVQEGAVFVTATFDDAAGTLALSVTAPAGKTPQLSGQLKTYCSEYPQPPSSAGAELPVDITMSAPGATLPGGEGIAAAAASEVADGTTTLRATLSAPALADKDYRCIEGTASDSPLLLYFKGHRHVALTVSNAEAAVRAEIMRRYGPPADGQTEYLSCPAARLTDSALCRYQIGRGGRVRVGTMVVDETERDLGTTIVASALYSQVPVRCARKLQRDEQIGGRFITEKRLAASKVLCGSTVPRALLVRAARSYPARATQVALSQVPAKGFEPLSRYRCKPNARRADNGAISYRWTCANALGDRLAFSFVVAADATRR